MEGFKHTIQIAVRFADLDVLGHLNNAKYATYCEQARIQYVMDVCGWQGKWETFSLILAKMTIDFKQPVVFGEHVTVHTRTERLGTKSLTLTCAMTRQSDGAVVAMGEFILVTFDYHTQSSVPIPSEWRAKITEYEGIEG